MILGGVILFFVAFSISLCGTALAKRYALRLGLMDDPGHRKVHTVPTPRNGGIGIFWGFALPLIVAILAVAFIAPAGSSGITVLGCRVPDSVALHLPGMRHDIPLAILFLVATFGMHVLGLLDDRKAMAPWPKLLAQLAIAAVLVIGGEYLVGTGAFRVVTFLGFIPSAIVSICWIVALTNAFNFLDNMDGLSAGIAFICAAMFLIAAVFNGQWFIAALLLLFMGSTLGFLCFNFPPASIFMGDGGSMVLGFILSVLTIRTTYYETGRQWYAVFMPVFVMAVPLYDLIIVSVLRLMKGRSPMQGDTNHFSHRLTRHGFSKRGAVLVIYGVTLATGITAPLLARVDDTSAILLAVQLLGMLVVIGLLERVGEHTQ
ncbi:MAG TPA: MraY family glycosyltransferase [Phycisphaerae bacterium]|nr:MraY family glycosyltransferase [Phycisphaerae bacterium]